MVDMGRFYSVANNRYIKMAASVPIAPPKSTYSRAQGCNKSDTAVS